MYDPEDVDVVNELTVGAAVSITKLVNVTVLSFPETSVIVTVGV